MPKHPFKTSIELKERIDAYFDYIKGEPDLEHSSVIESKAKTGSKQNIWIREPEPATFTGLAIFLGFHSKEAFERYERNGRFASVLKQGRLRVEEAYEKRLLSSPAGAIFVLKSEGWNEKAEPKKETKPGSKNLKVTIFEAGPKPAETEKDVSL
ncbi:MAG TPA: terminase small subunit [Mucilaginibacter sp.]|jgi:hypothetical protein